MRIAFFSDNFYPELSGITDTIITTGKELKKRGHEIVYVAPHYAPHDYMIATRQFPRSKNEDTIDGMPILRLPSLHMPLSPTGQSRFALPWSDALEEVARFKPDLIHTQSPYGTGWAAVKVARSLKVPLVGTNHTAIEDFYPPGMRAAMRRWDAFYYNHCDFITAPYQKLIDSMREVGFTKPGHAQANPADLHEFTPPSLELHAEHRTAFGLDGPTILYAGRLGVEKRVDVVVRAVALLSKEFPNLTFVATGHGAAQPGLERLVQRLGIGRHVRFTGYMSRALLPHIYQAADVFCIMSTSDSQSMALMQAFATGMPAVCAAARGLVDYCAPEAGFLVEPGNAQAAAEKIALLLRDVALRERMGAAAVEYVKKFAPEKIAEDWEKIYLRGQKNPSPTT